MVGKRVCALAAAAVLMGTGCKKDDVPEPEVPAADSRRVYVLCEGQYSVPTAALSVWLPDKDSVYADAFGAANAPAWGDVAQSLLLTDGEILICVNNGDRILVADRSTFRLKHTISVRKPRYIQPLNDSVAMVSTLFGNTLYRLSLKNYSITDSLSLPRKNPEGMVVQNGLLYVCPWDAAADKIYVISEGNRVVDSIPTGRAPHTIELDKNGRAWVLSGNAYDGVAAKLTRIDVAARGVEETYAFPPSADPVRLSFNATRDTFYYIGVNYNGTANNGVYRMSIGDAGLPAVAFISAQTQQYFWAVGVDPHTHAIYVGDPKGFTQKGTVRQYSPQGALLKEFSVGIGPNQFYFD